MSPTRERDPPAGTQTMPADPRPPARQRAIPTEVPPEPDDAAVGTQVGDWTISKRIGEGGMGAVYQARHTTTHVPVALKILLPPKKPEVDREAKQRFLNEAQVPTLIGVHPNIIQVFAFGILKDGPWSGRPWFAMEYLHGRSLDKKLALGPLPSIEEMRRLLSQVCDALATVHDKRVVHRDVKPANIFVAEPKHGESVAKLLDFGIAKIPARALTEVGACVGTLKYSAPEQLLLSSPQVDLDRAAVVGPEADIFGVGAVLYEVFAGSAPDVFAVADLSGDLPTRDGYPTITPALEKLIRDCLQKRKEDRPSSINEVKRRLLAALTEMATAAAVAPVPLVNPSSETSSAAALVVGAGAGRADRSPSGAGGRTSVVGAAREILFGARRRVYWALACALVLGLAAGMFAVWDRAGRAGKGSRAAAPEPAPPRIAAPLAAPVSSPTPLAAARAPEPAVRAVRRTPRPGPVLPASAARSSGQSALQPGPAAAPAIAPTADRGQSSAAAPVAPLPSAAPAIPAAKSSRPLTPSERDLITDKDTLFR